MLETLDPLVQQVHAAYPQTLYLDISQSVNSPLKARDTLHKPD